MESVKKHFSKKNIILLIIGAITLVLLYLFLPIFYTKNITILGNTNLKAGDLKKFSEETTEKNIYLVKTKIIEEEFRQSPYIKSISIKRKFPRTLIYQINERKPVASIKFSGGFAIIDDFGVVLRTSQDINDIVKPLIKGIKLSEITIGKEIASEDINNLTTSLDALSNVKTAQLLNNISQIDISDPQNIYMITPQGITVLLGEGKDMNQKMRVLNKILIDLFERKIYSGYVDMRYDAYPVYRSKK